MVNSVVTAKIKIPVSNEIVETVLVYSKALQFCIDMAWKKKIKNNIKLHYAVYAVLRKTFKLPSQLSIACISQACGMVKKAKNKPVIKKASVGYNFPRSARLKNNTLIFKTLHGRQEVSIDIPACYKEYFTWKICESLLRIDKKCRAFFLFTFSKELNAVKRQNGVLGVDLGINNLAVTSDGTFFNSAKIKCVKRKFKFLRGILQCKGTRSATRLLRLLSGRETRYMTWVNHTISKNIVTSFDGNKIVMEDLKGIRKQQRGKIMNYWINNWSFYQLQKFIQYKSMMNGIEVVKVNPAYTSQLCHKCGQLGTRSKGCFSCHCGLRKFSADLNASRNLAHPKLVERQVAVKQPCISNDEAKAQRFRELRPSSEMRNYKNVMPHSFAVTGIVFV